MIIDALTTGIPTLALIMLAEAFAPSRFTLSGMIVGFFKVYAVFVPTLVTVSLLAGRSIEVVHLLVLSLELCGLATLIGIVIKGSLRRLHIKETSK